jgi:hypothetical protein
MTPTAPRATPMNLVTARQGDGRSLIADIDPDRTSETSPLQRALAEATARTANVTRRTT